MADPARYDPFGDPDDMFTVVAAAYYRVEARGFEDGSPEDHWYEEEAELRDRFNAADDEFEEDLTSGGDTAGIETTGERTWRI